MYSRFYEESDCSDTMSQNEVGPVVRIQNAHFDTSEIKTGTPLIGEMHIMLVRAGWRRENLISGPFPHVDLN
jgi:hypothetical protein